jgi:hypothetical protein
MKCKACENPCHEIRIDVGAGAYEFWGATGVDVREVDVSNCCEADIVYGDDDELETVA